MISVTALGKKMEKQITIDLINNFSNIYNSNSTNRII